MYQLYCDRLIENYHEDSPVTESYYRHIFNTDFNMGSAPPIYDTCNYCDKMENKLQNSDKSNDAQQVNQLYTELQSHIKRAQMVQTILKNISKHDDLTIAAIAIDLQQALPTPKINSGIQYYEIKLWTYNFGIMT